MREPGVPYSPNLSTYTIQSIDTLNYILGGKRNKRYSVARKLTERALDALPARLGLLEIPDDVPLQRHFFTLSPKRSELLEQEAAERNLPPASLVCQIVEFEIAGAILEIPEIGEIIQLGSAAVGRHTVAALK